MKAMLTKVLSALLVVTITAGVAITGTLAFLTDRDSEANVFTTGDVSIDLNEDFNQGSTLIPGVDIEKEPTITNTGKNDAWVWAEIAIPAALDNEDASKNVIHFNFTEESLEYWQWTDGGNYMVRNQEIEGVDYNVYTVLYKEALKPGEITAEPVMTKVYMDDHIDIDPNGDWYHVENGVVSDKLWSKADGNPVIYVSAYAMQTEGFATVQEAYAAYTEQWTTDANVNNGLEWGKPAAVTEVSTAAELTAALANGGVVVLTNDVELEEVVTIAADKEAVLNLNGNDITFTTPANENASYHAIVVKGDLTVTGEGTIVMNDNTGAAFSPSYQSTPISVQGGTLTLNEGVTVDANAGNEMAYAVDVNTTLGESVLNINGATLNSSYIAVRIFNNNKTEKGIVNFNSGTIVGEKNGYDIWAQNMSNPAENAVVNIAVGINYSTADLSGVMYYIQ